MKNGRVFIASCLCILAFFETALAKEEIYGVGIEIGNYENSIIVLSIHKDSMAYKSRMKIGDEILEINNQPVVNMELEKVESLMVDYYATDVDFTIRHSDSEKSEKIRIATVCQLEGEKYKGENWGEGFLILYMCMITCAGIWFIWERQRAGLL